jgi:hypothetical protein
MCLPWLLSPEFQRNNAGATGLFRQVTELACSTSLAFFPKSIRTLDICRKLASAVRLSFDCEPL